MSRQPYPYGSQEAKDALLRDGNFLHAPREQYDCDRCKFSWCCGSLCSCHLQLASLPVPPTERQAQVDTALVKIGYAPQFRGNGAQRR
jgi:hypothetical protein